MEVFGGLSTGSGKGKNGEKMQGLRSTNWQVQNRWGHVKNSIGNGVVIELTCMIHGRELSGGNSQRECGVLGGGDKGGKIGTTVIA